MRAVARVRAVATTAGTHMAELRSEPPLVLRATPDALYLVGGAGGPLGGDDLELHTDVGQGATLRVRSAAATLAQPGAAGGTSRLRSTIHVGGGATLDWAPEPLVSVRGSDHVVETELVLAASAHVTFVEELVLGRDGEPPGRIRTSLRVRTVSGVELCAHDLDLGRHAGAWDGPAGVGAARFVTSVLRVDPGRPSPAPLAVTTGDGRAARFPLPAGATVSMALASTRAGAWRLLAAAGAHEMSGAASPAAFTSG